MKQPRKSTLEIADQVLTYLRGPRDYMLVYSEGDRDNVGGTNIDLKADPKVGKQFYFNWSYLSRNVKQK